MHAYDRTILAGLGYNDPDKKDPRHQLVCQFLAESPQREKLCEFLGAHRVIGAHVEVPLSKGEGKYKTTVGFLDVVLEAWTFITAKPLATPAEYRKAFDEQTEKLQRLYKIEAAAEQLCGPPWQQSKSQEDRDRHQKALLVARQCADDCRQAKKACAIHADRSVFVVEVKLAVVVDQIIRQINLYREHKYAERWVLATPDPVSRPDRRLLEAENIICVSLPTTFDEWRKSHDKEVAVPDRSGFEL